jgi:monofunctional glycosyltransferase
MGRRLARFVRIIAWILAAIVLVPLGLTLVYGFVRPVSTIMLWRWATARPVERVWIPLDKVSPALVAAVVVAEDGQYCRHHGVDLRSVAEILEKESLREARGGSTITQQTAKNLFLWTRRSFARKALEFPLALWLDFVLGKRRVLEIYLNVAEWGPNGEFGVEAGARRAFGKSAADLDPAEAALLAAILPNPHRRDARQPSPQLRRLAGIYAGREGVGRRMAACVQPRGRH